MKIQDFEKELQAIDSNLAIRPNNPPQRVKDAFPDITKIASVTYMGTELCSCPADDIYDEVNNSYGVDIRGDGRFVAHRTRPTVLKIVRETLEKLKNKNEADAFFGRGDYSDAALRKSDDRGTVTLVDEVPADVKQVEGGMIEGAK